MMQSREVPKVTQVTPIRSFLQTLVVGELAASSFAETGYIQNVKEPRQPLRAV
jgi:hypothetical protein